MINFKCINAIMKDAYIYNKCRCIRGYIYMYVCVDVYIINEICE